MFEQYDVSDVFAQFGVSDVVVFELIVFVILFGASIIHCVWDLLAEWFASSLD